MFRSAGRVVRKTERAHHLHLLLDEAHHLLRGALGGNGPEGEMVDARDGNSDGNTVRLSMLMPRRVKMLEMELNRPTWFSE